MPSVWLIILEFCQFGYLFFKEQVSGIRDKVMDKSRGQMKAPPHSFCSGGHPDDGDSVQDEGLRTAVLVDSYQ